ncbi:cytochrome P450 [Annulohypoxylon maeteangense]|uniref:cytochrome P450 n=1 Tax=Annulohypoxylon maeteangense TaxID=1927788 RepID=UPI002008840C|nr:cytochrome P450 [Annulohypoxylon maeteangense]KAI0883156.1 cytochrome P450 [Annulohypoxylon maeteangense]
MLSVALSPTAAGLAVVVMGITYWLGWCIYCIWFHPLSKYPGPRAAAVSDIWFVWAWTTGRYPHILDAAHRKYGDVVRISPNELSFGTIQAHRDIYSTPSKTKKPFPKCGIFYNNGDESNIFYELDPAEHARMRKTLAPGFTGVAMKTHEHIIHQYVDMFVHKVGEICSMRRGAGVDVVEAVPWLAFDVMGELTFGESFNAVASGQTHFWISILSDSAHAAILPSFIRRAPSLILMIPFMLSLTALRNLKKHYSYTLETVRRRIARSDTAERDIFTPVLEQEGGITERQLVSLAQAMIIAGADTVTTAMTTALYFLCATPGCLEKLEREVRALDYDQLTGVEVTQMRYLDAVIEEAMRCFPPLAFGLPRVSPGEFVDGYFVPKGARLSAPHWVLNHNPQVWDNPNEFRPERWLRGEKSNPDQVTFPFSTGPRSCIGMAQANLEMRITLAKLVHTFDIKAARDPGDWIGDAQMNMMWKKAPLMVDFRPRNRDGLDYVKKQ